MSTIERLVTNSTLTRLFAILFLFVIVIGSSFICGYQLINGIAPNPMLIGFLGVAIGSSIKILGISAGVTFAHNEYDRENKDK